VNQTSKGYTRQTASDDERKNEAKESLRLINSLAMRPPRCTSSEPRHAAIGWLLIAPSPRGELGLLVAWAGIYSILWFGYWRLLHIEHLSAAAAWCWNWHLMHCSGEVRSEGGGVVEWGGHATCEELR
jgi:hypothetical protein